MTAKRWDLLGLTAGMPGVNQRCPVDRCGVRRDHCSQNVRWYSLETWRSLLVGLLDDKLAAEACNNHICPARWRPHCHRKQLPPQHDPLETLAAVVEEQDDRNQSPPPPPPPPLSTLLSPLQQPPSACLRHDSNFLASTAARSFRRALSDITNHNSPRRHNTTL